MSDTFKERLRQAAEARSQRQREATEAEHKARLDREQSAARGMALRARFSREVPQLLSPIVDGVRETYRGRCHIMPERLGAQGEWPELGYRLISTDDAQLQDGLFVIALEQQGEVVATIELSPGMPTTRLLGGRELLRIGLDQLRALHLEDAMMAYVDYAFGNELPAGFVD